MTANKLDASKIHIYLGTADEAFRDFKSLAETDGGSVISFLTKEQFKERFELEDKDNWITYARFVDTTTSSTPANVIPTKTEWIIREFEKSYAAKKPILLQGIERLQRVCSLDSVLAFLDKVTDHSANYSIPVFIPMNKSFYIEQKLEQYLNDENVVIHNGNGSN